jgi:hypothetical protein
MPTPTLRVLSKEREFRVLRAPIFPLFRPHARLKFWDNQTILTADGYIYVLQELIEWKLEETL